MYNAQTACGCCSDFQVFMFLFRLFRKECLLPDPRDLKPEESVEPVNCAYGYNTHGSICNELDFFICNSLGFIV